MVRGETHQKKNENQTKGGFTGFSKAEEYLAPRAVGGTVGGSRRRGWPGGEHCPAHLRARGSSGNALVAVPGYGRAPRAISAGLRTRVRGLSCRHRRPLPGARRVHLRRHLRRRHSTRATRAGTCLRTRASAPPAQHTRDPRWLWTGRLGGTRLRARACAPPAQHTRDPRWLWGGRFTGRIF